MVVATLELIRAREAAQRLLDQLGLEAYLFQVEPALGDWRLMVECAAGDGWSTTTLNLNKDELLASAADVEVYRRLLAEWRLRLGECKARPN